MYHQGSLKVWWNSRNSRPSRPKLNNWWFCIGGTVRVRGKPVSAPPIGSSRANLIIDSTFNFHNSIAYWRQMWQILSQIVLCGWLCSYEWGSWFVSARDRLEVLPSQAWVQNWFQWYNLNWLQVWPPDGATSIWLQIWPPGGRTCISYKPVWFTCIGHCLGLPYWYDQLVLSW